MEISVDSKTNEVNARWFFLSPHYSLVAAGIKICLVKGGSLLIAFKAFAHDSHILFVDLKTRAFAHALGELREERKLNLVYFTAVLAD